MNEKNDINLYLERCSELLIVNLRKFILEEFFIHKQAKELRFMINSIIETKEAFNNIAPHECGAMALNFTE